MRKQVTRYVWECQVCQQFKSWNQSPTGLLQHLPIPSQVWEHISMDFIEGLPKSDRVDTILVVIDRLTKYGHFIALKHPFTTLQVEAKFVNEVVRLHGFPTTIISNRDKIFMSVFWREMFRLQQTRLLRSTAYHPQTDGESEVVNKMVETRLLQQWLCWLHWEEFSYNTSPYLSMKMSPFQVVRSSTSSCGSDGLSTNHCGCPRPIITGTGCDLR